ncbi:hypothetical protein GCM10010401_02900 [Rarobacter faecitabidus]|uniref:DUF6458 domain-containing protein n=1 Tax=Rarobacter faecitabidus TaxID=13243 RepID=A0A542ZUB6_RARFA|nr:DUF6458 family protein [Rarobacter faecitabidus]TQL63953.1 hypothetical protein FB461_0433 [Rarobacter faecitabidus]
MTISTGIVLFVIGAILTFAVNVEFDAISLDLIGYILMGAGVVVFIIGLITMTTARRRTVDRVERVDRVGPID